MNNYEASKIGERVAIARLANGRYIAFYADRHGKSVGGQAYEGASIGEAVRALENSADEDGTHPEDAPWRSQAAY